MAFVLSGFMRYVQDTTTCMLLQGKREDEYIYQQVTCTGLDLTVTCACFSWWRGTPGEKYWYCTCENSLFYYYFLFLFISLIFAFDKTKTNLIVPLAKKKKQPLSCLIMTSPRSDMSILKFIFWIMLSSCLKAVTSHLECQTGCSFLVCAQSRHHWAWWHGDCWISPCSSATCWPGPEDQSSVATSWHYCREQTSH